MPRTLSFVGLMTSLILGVFAAACGNCAVACADGATLTLRPTEGVFSSGSYHIEVEDVGTATVVVDGKNFEVGETDGIDVKITSGSRGVTAFRVIVSNVRPPYLQFRLSRDDVQIADAKIDMDHTPRGEECGEQCVERSGEAMVSGR